MIVGRSRYELKVFAVIIAAASLCGAPRTASAQVLFSEDFEDDMLAENAMVNANVTIENGIAKFNDPATGRATFSVVNDITDPVVTFSFDVVEAVVESEPPAQMELVIRAGIGTGHNTLSNAEHIAETIIYRSAADPTRGDYMNTGNETIFMIANNNSSELTFTSPIDNVTQLTVPGFHSKAFVRDNATGMFGDIGGNNDFRPENMASFGTFNRFAIGSSSNAHVGTFALDNVLVASGVSFEQEIGPEPILGDTDGDGIVELEDFDPIRDNFRMNVSSRTQGDLDRSGLVDLADFKQWKTAFVGAGGSVANVDFGFLSNVPEPGTIQLVLFGALAALARGKHRVRNSGSGVAT